MKIYVYTNEYYEMVGYVTCVDDFKKKYDGILITSEAWKTLGKKKIYNLIKEFGYALLLYKENSKIAGTLTPLNKLK